MPDLELKSPQQPHGSAIKRSGLGGFLSRLFGFQRTSNNNIEFTKVDVSSDQRIGQALLNSTVMKTPMSEKLESLFQTWLSDNTDKLTELSQRAQRVSQLQYMYLNDPYVNRTVALYADEASQLDEQDTIIRIETPDPRMTKDMYKLLNQWGVTQVRIRATLLQLALYGDAFWSNKVTDRGVERIIPLQQLQVTDRVEFNPIKVLELQKRKSGALYNALNKNYLLNSMFNAMTSSEDFTDMFDTKLFGFEIDSDLVVPPWSISHFRVGGEASDFWPWGTSLVLGALSPYKQTQSALTLQSLARMMSFPITLYKVKTDENMDEARQFAVVNKVREAYDNIGVNPAAGNSEVYTVNTKIWVPDGLLTVEVEKPEISTDNVDDIKLYQDREAVSLGLPKSFFGDEGWYSVNKSGKSLIQQYKPFGRAAFSLQSAFLETLADLYRIHFAITGQYDFRIPFTLSMKYPVLEEDDDRSQAKKDSLDLATAVMDFVKGAIGAGEDEGLPPDIARDIIGKYTFLDPADIMKWTRDMNYNRLEAIANSDVGEDSDEDNDSLGLEDLGGEDTDTDEDTGDTGLDLESTEESLHNERLRLREKRLLEKYEESKDEIYFKVLENLSIDNYSGNGYHTQVFDTVPSENDLMLETLSANNNKSRLKENTFTKTKKRKK